MLQMTLLDSDKMPYGTAADEAPDPRRGPFCWDFSRIQLLRMTSLDTRGYADKISVKPDNTVNMNINNDKSDEGILMKKRNISAKKEDQ